jgi:hypothetical protein
MNKNYKNQISLVITTINKPNKVINKYLELTKKNKIYYLIIGDKKTPNYNKKYNFFNLKKQKSFDFNCHKLLPYNSYSRKNIGYLIAMKNNSKIIVETDDDNYPKDNFFKNLEIKKILKEYSGPEWINVLKIFKKNNKLIWPRGFPLNLINDKKKLKAKRKEIFSPIQQRMCDGDPDVDAIYRLTNKLEDHIFRNDNIAIDNKSICPFNSQNTVWHEVAFPLIYLPSYCTMRSTDIWRGFIALKIIKNYNWNLTFLRSTVIQNRNIHDLMDDFKQEIPVYENTIKLCNILKKLKLRKKYKDILINLYNCYEKLVSEKILNKNELPLLKEWLKDVNLIYPNLNKV